MSSFVIQGGNKLSGNITPQGAKNEALQVLCACLLTDQPIEFQNIPDIRDVNKLISLLQGMGVKVTRPDKNSVILQAQEIDFNYLESESFREEGGKIRGSIMLAGPLLARYKLAYISKPGGDKIGRRRLDTHFVGLLKMGATLDYNEELCLYTAKTPGLKGTYILQDEASVTGTANIIMAACLASGTTTLFNAACEPYLVQLCLLLSQMGANIIGIGSNLLTITGVKRLGGATHTLLPDMIEVGSFIGLAAMTRSSLTIKNVQTSTLGIIPDVFKRLGVTIIQKGNNIFIPEKEEYEVETFMDGSIMTVADAPWPGFTPDLISIALVIAIQAKGSVLIHQKMFESRLSLIHI